MKASWVDLGTCSISPSKFMYAYIYMSMPMNVMPIMTIYDPKFRLNAWTTNSINDFPFLLSSSDVTGNQNVQDQTHNLGNPKKSNWTWLAYVTACSFSLSFSSCSQKANIATQTTWPHTLNNDADDSNHNNKYHLYTLVLWMTIRVMLLYYYICICYVTCEMRRIHRGRTMSHQHSANGATENNARWTHHRIYLRKQHENVVLVCHAMPCLIVCLRWLGDGKTMCVAWMCTMCVCLCVFWAPSYDDTDTRRMWACLPQTWSGENSINENEYTQPTQKRKKNTCPRQTRGCARAESRERETGHRRCWE